MIAMSATPATPEQIGYLKRLSVQTGRTDLQLCAVVAKTAFEELTKSEASTVIGTLKSSTEKERKAENDRPRFATALVLRKAAESGEPAPAYFDEHARWVLENLKLAIAVRSLTSHTAAAGGQRGGVNQGGDIRMSDLLAHFKTWDVLARAFDVTVPTAKAWGEILPSSRSFEAQVKTEGFVTAPRGRS